ncbi:hypothetical protein [Kitasatospora sp. McL0602]|uniref:hypothetical protein n=1 Tax=Kitasatospora sp. McL0602 TaxID=3439530 RepID=UPI003F8A85AD
MDTDTAVQHLTTGTAALRAQDYTAATEALQQHLAAHPRDAVAHYRLALAILAGQDPRDQHASTLDTALRHLHTAAVLDPALHCAEVAALLVQDAALHRWGRHQAALNHLELRLVARLSPAVAQELTLHVAAPHSVWWAALRGLSPTSGGGGDPASALR